jgi:hypothetical protein
MKILWMRFPLTITTTVGLLGLLAAPALAQNAPAVAQNAPVVAQNDSVAPLETPEPTPAEAPPSVHAFRPFFIHESFGVNAVTYTAASGKAAASTVTPSDKTILFQQVGVGYWVHPHIRLQVTGIFAETVSGLKPGASSFTLGGVIPCVFYTNGGFFAGGGPLFAPRAFGANGFNVGIFTLGGYAFQLGRGVSLAAAVQVPVMLAQKDSVAVTPAVVLGERF